MKIWHPAPRGLIHAAAVERWTKENPAPDLVVYLWVYSQRDEGEAPTRRQVARLFGWSEHRSRKMISRVGQDHKEWLIATSPKLRTSGSPPKSNKTNNLQKQNAQDSPTKNRDSPYRGRASTRHHTYKTGTEAVCLEEMPEWQALK